MAVICSMGQKLSAGDYKSTAAGKKCSDKIHFTLFAAKIGMNLLIRQTNEFLNEWILQAPHMLSWNRMVNAKKLKHSI